MEKRESKRTSRSLPERRSRSLQPCFLFPISCFLLACFAPSQPKEEPPPSSAATSPTTGSIQTYVTLPTEEEPQTAPASAPTLPASLAASQPTSQPTSLPPLPIAHSPLPALRVVIYGASWCPACRAAKKYLLGRHIRFTWRDIETDLDARKELGAQLRAANTRYYDGMIPVITVDSLLLIGFNQGELARELHRAKIKASY